MLIQQFFVELLIELTRTTIMAALGWIARKVITEANNEPS